MRVLNDNLLVKELQKNLTNDGILIKYDDSNPYMFVKLMYDLPNTFAEELGVEAYELPNLVFMIKRVAKIPVINDCFAISKKDIICFMTRKEFDEL